MGWGKQLGVGGVKVDGTGILSMSHLYRSKFRAIADGIEKFRMVGTYFPCNPTNSRAPTHFDILLSLKA
jgi:hypothetical protein